jgi:hypothetical protein
MQIALLFAAAIVMLIAPVMLVSLALAHPSLTRAAASYTADKICSSPAVHGLPPPTRPIPVAMRNATPCAIRGAMVTEKDTISQGLASVTRYALGLRSDAGAESVATLDDGDAQSLWSSTQPGDRVVLQTLNGRVDLVGDGTRTVRTDSNPLAVAQANALGMWIAGGICALELVAVGLFISWRRTASSVGQSMDA